MTCRAVGVIGFWRPNSTQKDASEERFPTHQGARQVFWRIFRLFSGQAKRLGLQGRFRRVEWGGRRPFSPLGQTRCLRWCLHGLLTASRLYFVRAIRTDRERRITSRHRQAADLANLTPDPPIPRGIRRQSASSYGLAVPRHPLRQRRLHKASHQSQFPAAIHHRGR